MELLLNPGELLDLGENFQKLTIICRSGTCWITQTGDPRDYILRSGQQFIVRTKGQLILNATDACRLLLITQEETAHHPPIRSAVSLQ